MACTVRSESILYHIDIKMHCKCTIAIKPSCSLICNIACSLSIQTDIVEGMRMSRSLTFDKSSDCMPVQCCCHYTVVPFAPSLLLPPCLPASSPPVNDYLYSLTDSLMIPAQDQTPPVTLLLKILPSQNAFLLSTAVSTAMTWFCLFVPSAIL